MGETLMVGMAEVKVTRRKDDVFIALAIGRCVSLCAYDSHTGVMGMAQIVLPCNDGNPDTGAKFADTGVPLLLEEMQKKGAVLSRIRVALVGGAQIFAFDAKGHPLDTGIKTVNAVTQELERRNIRIIATDTGGMVERNVTLLSNGRVRVQTAEQGEHELVWLGYPVMMSPTGSLEAA